ncbi:hypothetical protein M0811_09541 [Anaeramoeba ignava]|uniref:Uncharacterized protein n=1 Tax=Anaeramoeba ignava TaxID=1746090 RepID=A0A9Q0R9Q5_ANAIG|nr:hypothetical protein M0811_09541 [Anaeramoeba ignava]
MTNLSQDTYSSFKDIWLGFVIWVVVIISLIYFIVGLVALNSVRKISGFWVPFALALIGAIFAFGYGSVCGVLIASIYESGPFLMTQKHLALYACGFSVLYLIVSLTRTATFLF